MSRFVFPRLEWISHIFTVTMCSDAVTEAEVKVPTWIYNLNKRQNTIDHGSAFPTPDLLLFYLQLCFFSSPATQRGVSFPDSPETLD